MTRQLAFLASAAIGLAGTQLHAQLGGGMGGPASGPGFSGAMTKLFGEHEGFTATVQFEFTQGGTGESLSMPAQISFLEGKTRFEMDLAGAKSESLPAEAVAQMKQLGMDKMVTISLPEQKAAYLIYPGLEAYVELPNQNPDDLRPASDFEMEVTELGKETLDGHDCVKNKVVVSDKEGNQHESTVWNASDLKKFPVKIETSEGGHEIVMVFSDVKLSKPSASSFEAPSAYTKYDNMMAMMQQVMKKRMGGSGGTPPGN